MSDEPNPPPPPPPSGEQRLPEIPPEDPNWKREPKPRPPEKPEGMHWILKTLVVMGMSLGATVLIGVIGFVFLLATCRMR